MNFTVKKDFLMRVPPVLFLCLLMILIAAPLSAQPQPHYRILGYFASWGIYDRGYDCDRHPRR